MWKMPSARLAKWVNLTHFNHPPSLLNFDVKPGHRHCCEVESPLSARATFRLRYRFARVRLWCEKRVTMPFETRPVATKAWKALNRVVAANEAMREAEAKRARQAKKRAKAIQEARKNGLSLDVIAERLGVSRERVRQMVARQADR
jgi:hypothetical protein